MNKNQYDDKVKNIKELIELGKIREAEKEIELMKNLRPWSLSYICAQVKLMLIKGENKSDCINILDNICQEGYICDELAEIFELKQQFYAKDSIQWKLCDFSTKLYQKNDKEQVYCEKLEKYKADFMNSNDTGRWRKIRQLAEAYYIVRNMNMYFVLMMVWCIREDKQDKYEDYICEEAGQAFYGMHSHNLGYLAKLLQDEVSYEFLLIESLKNDNADISILSWALKAVGNKTIIINKPILCEKYEQDKVKVSMLNAEVKADSIYIHPVLENINDENEYSIVAAGLIQFLANSLEQDVALTVFSQDLMMDKIQGVKEHAKHFQRLSESRPKQFSYAMAFAWAGDYCKYMSYIYGFSVRERIDRPAECDVSIVIPVRNSVDTLRYTLQTCLNQKCDADYEIVLSDNSDEGNSAIYDLYKELHDPRIHYYRTPFMMNLTKSFEFAFLQARGKFIFSIGADDGVFPWTVQRIMMALPVMKDSDILQWNRGFYGWPNFNPRQRNILSCNLVENKLPMVVHKRSLRDDFAVNMQNIESGLYGIPFFYINSGFKREYYHKLLQDTGRLWDGSSQDLYMGAINLSINDFCYYLNEPLSVAGMSSNSIGANNTSTRNSLTAVLNEYSSANRLFSNQLGCYVQLPSEKLLPNLNGVGHDILGFYRLILRLYDMKIVGTEIIEKFDINNIILKFMKINDYSDSLFYQRWYSILACINEPMNKTSMEYFDKYNITINIIECNNDNKICYIPLKTGYCENDKTIVINVANFNINDISGAVKLVSNLMDLRL